MRGVVSSKIPIAKLDLLYTNGVNFQSGWFVNLSNPSNSNAAASLIAQFKFYQISILVQLRCAMRIPDVN